jgi:hypothetical protein
MLKKSLHIDSSRPSRRSNERPGSILIDFMIIGHQGEWGHFNDCWMLILNRYIKPWDRGYES